MDERRVSQRRRVQSARGGTQGEGRSDEHTRSAMRRIGLVAVLVLASTAMSSSQQLPSEPMRQFGQSVTGAFEGWYQNPDGSYTFLVGYLNRNFAQSVEIPI